MKECGDYIAVFYLKSGDWTRDWKSAGLDSVNRIVQMQLNDANLISFERHIRQRR